MTSELFSTYVLTFVVGLFLGYILRHTKVLNENIVLILKATDSTNRALALLVDAAARRKACKHTEDK